MAYKVIILYQLYMPSYFLGTFTEYPYLFFYFFLLTCYSLSLSSPLQFELYPVFQTDLSIIIWLFYLISLIL